MTQYKTKHDIISEHEYNQQMSSMSTIPEYESPRDSEYDSAAEFKLGLNYKTEAEGEIDDVSEVVNDEEEFMAGDNFIGGDNSDVEREMTAVDRSVWAREKRHPVKDIPETAKVVSSEMAAPWMDAESRSDTH